ncbi:AzlD domain-containing protein [Desulfocurvus sp. DL9XJH121]
MDQQTIFLTILGMALVTYVPRALPLVALASRSLPDVVARFLGFVPTAVLAALLAPCVLVRDGALDASLSNVFLLAAVPTFAVAIAARSFFGAVAVGMASVAAGRWFLGL